MDRTTCITEVWDEILKFNNEYFPNWKSVSETYYSNALAGEVGEVCNAVKHRDGGGTKKSCPTDLELMTELADVFIYMQMIVESMSGGCHDITSLADAIKTKMKTNVERMNK